MESSLPKGVKPADKFSYITETNWGQNIMIQQIILVLPLVHPSKHIKAHIARVQVSILKQRAAQMQQNIKSKNNVF